MGGHEEEGSHEACHEGSGSSHEGHEGHEEEGSHGACHEGSSSSGANEGHEGHEEEGSHEACHEGSGCAKGHEGHEGQEVNMSSGFRSRISTLLGFVAMNLVDVQSITDE